LEVSIIVIDNGSTDGTNQLVENQYPMVRLVQIATNLGFGQANNIGLRMAMEEQADYAFLLNQDAWLQPGALEYLVEMAKSNSEYGVLSPVHLNGKGDALEYSFSNFIAPKNCPGLYSDALLQYPMKPVYETSFVNAAAWLLPRRTLEMVGGFDPIFFHYGEDDNYVQRLHYHNLKVGVCPKAFIYHDKEHQEPTDLHKKLMERKLALMSYADVNSNGPARLERELMHLKRQYQIRKWLLRNRSAAHLKAKIDFLESIYSDCRKSWHRNRSLGPNYLN
jgi:GT2 family glycosyltransferase